MRRAGRIGERTKGRAQAHATAHALATEGAGLREMGRKQESYRDGKARVQRRDHPLPFAPRLIPPPLPFSPPSLSDGLSTRAPRRPRSRALRSRAQPTPATVACNIVCTAGSSGGGAACHSRCVADGAAAGQRPSRSCRFSRFHSRPSPKLLRSAPVAFRPGSPDAPPPGHKAPRSPLYPAWLPAQRPQLVPLLCGGFSGGSRRRTCPIIDR
ncbi:hypothetical protein C8Q78DRAFT_44482 [Trametes maxima]|nr:hypothetical protein C8Q78DRAFT_44482 [Trametes maxima]